MIISYFLRPNDTFLAIKFYSIERPTGKNYFFLTQS